MLKKRKHYINTNKREGGHMGLFGGDDDNKDQAMPPAGNDAGGMPPADNGQGGMGGDAGTPPATPGAGDGGAGMPPADGDAGGDAGAAPGGDGNVPPVQ